MANWYTAEYTFTGDRNSLVKLHEFLKETERQYADEDGTRFCYLLTELGVEQEEIMSRGYWTRLSFNGDTLTFETWTANQLVHQIMYMLTQRYPGTEYFYFTDACHYQTNDKEGRYYPQRFVMDFDGVYYFNDETSLLNRITELTGQPFDSIDAAKNYLKSNPDYEDSYFGIYEVGVIDTCDALTIYLDDSYKGKLVRPDGSVVEEFTITLGNNINK